MDVEGSGRLELWLFVESFAAATVFDIRYIGMSAGCIGNKCNAEVYRVL